MKHQSIKGFLTDLGVNVDAIDLTVYDILGERMARKARDRDSALARKRGLFFRPNYERGILINEVMKRFGCTSYLEVGFGRGYSAACAALSQAERGLPVNVTVVDPFLDEAWIQRLEKEFPFMKGITYVKLPSEEFWSTRCADNEMWDFVYIDGAHSAEATRADWQGAKRHAKAFTLFDDYHLPSKDDPGIACAQAIDEIDGYDKALIIMDRRIFADDLMRSDADIDYGQVLVSMFDTVTQ